MTQPPPLFQSGRLSLNGFAKERAQLVREMEDSGWTGRITANGHAFMRAPDGQTTCSVAPKTGSPTRANGNSASVYKRWLKQKLDAENSADPDREDIQTVNEPAAVAPRATPPAPVDTAPELQVCGDCGQPFKTLQALSVHHVRAHVRVSCPICARRLSPGNLPRHQRTHVEGTELVDVLRQLHQARQEVEDARAEVATWRDLAEEAERAYAALQQRVRAALSQ